MKVFVASEIHGSSYYMKKLAEKIEEEKPEQIILLGDLYFVSLQVIELSL